MKTDIVGKSGTQKKYYYPAGFCMCTACSRDTNNLFYTEILQHSIQSVQTECSSSQWRLLPRKYENQTLPDNLTVTLITLYVELAEQSAACSWRVHVCYILFCSITWPTHLSHSCMAPQPDAQVCFLQILDAIVNFTYQEAPQACMILQSNQKTTCSRMPHRRVNRWSINQHSSSHVASLHTLWAGGPRHYPHLHIHTWLQI